MKVSQMKSERYYIMETFLRRQEKKRKTSFRNCVLWELITNIVQSYTPKSSERLSERTSFHFTLIKDNNKVGLD